MNVPLTIAGNKKLGSEVYVVRVSSTAAPSPSAEARVPRHKVFLPAEMTGLDGKRRVHLLNLSQTGALIHGDAPPAAGTTVQLRCRETGWIVRVVWTCDKRFGVVHVTPLARATVAALVGGPLTT